MRVAAAIACILLAAPAAGQTRLSVEALGGYASEARTFVVGGTSAYRLGFGLRAGVSLPKLYLGVAVTHHLGTHDVARAAGLAYDARYNTTLFGPEVGYVAAVGRRGMLRPYVGGGPQYEHSRTLLNGSESNKSHWRPYLSGGLVAAYRFDHAFVGVDLRAILSPLRDATQWAPGAFAILGASF